MVSWFSGVGGFDQAFVRAGHEIVGACDLDPFARRVYEARFGAPPWFPTDISDVRAKDVPDAEVWCGGPPCQSFSVAGARGGLAEARGNLVLVLLALAAERKPATLLLENVPGLLSADGGEAFGTILARLDDIGYETEWATLDARWFGVPQRRRRVFILARLRGGPPALLPATPGRPDAVRQGAGWTSLQVGLFGAGDAFVEWPNAGRLRGGRLWVRPTDEWREPRSVSSLADVLVRGEVPVRYYLSARACEGILRRAARRGRELPGALRAALEGTAGRGGTWDGEVRDNELADDQAVRPGRVFADPATDLPVGPLLAPTAGSGARVDAESATNGHLIVSALGAAQGGPDDNDAQSGRLIVADAFGERGVAAALTAHPGGRYDADSVPDRQVAVSASCAPRRLPSLVSRGGFESAQGGTVVATPPAPQAFEVVGGAQSSRLHAKPRDTTGALQTRGNKPTGNQAGTMLLDPIAFSSKDHGADAGGESPTLRAAGHDASHANGGVQHAGVCSNGERARALRSALHGSQKTGASTGGGGRGVIPTGKHAGSVRRLLPIETERLMGWPDGWTCLCGAPELDCECPDGARYRACGNGVVSPVVDWIVGRLTDVEVPPTAALAYQARHKAAGLCHACPAPSRPGLVSCKAHA